MRRRAAGALLVALLLGPLLGVGEARGAEYSMQTVARYVANAAAQRVEVGVDVTFTNSTPDPPGHLSGFDRIDVGIHAGASDVLARDAAGPLGVVVEERDGVLVASVKARTRIRYNRVADFTLSYELVDGQAPGVHVRPQVIAFAAWGFGTASEVTVDLPAAYAVDISGDPLTPSTEGEVIRLSSGPIADPSRWLALVTATQTGTYVTTSQSVALTSGTVDLQVRSWTDDAAWGEHALALLARALPILEEAIGLPYTRIGPLVVTEAATGSGALSEPVSSNAEILVAFDEPDFTLLHQAVHVWVGEQLASDRWIREGLASHFAAVAADRLGVPLPYTPAERATELAADAIPLADWGPTPATPAADAYAYAASWAFADRIAAAVGAANLVEAIRRASAGLSAYDPRAADPSLPGELGAPPLDTRRLLDQLASVSGIDLADTFREVVLEQSAGVELIHRAAARASYFRLLAAAGDWGAPDSVRLEMTEWRFDDATAGIHAALAWLAERDRLVEQITAAGLTTPDRLRARYMVAGGGPAAADELAAEWVVVEAYDNVRAQIAAPRGWFGVIGLIGSDDPPAALRAAALSFADGDLTAAADTLAVLAVQLGRATADGLTRAAIVVVLVAMLGAVAMLAIRRRRGSHYTAAP